MRGKRPAGFLARLLSGGPGHTRAIARDLGSACRPGSVIALEGGLGSGKTVFVQGLAKGLGIRRPEEVRSPTFALIQEHPGRLPLCHADLYRITAEEAEDIGLSEYWRGASAGDWVTAVEWADRAGRILPRRTLLVRLLRSSQRGREITFWGRGEWPRVLAGWKEKWIKKS